MKTHRICAVAGVVIIIAALAVLGGFFWLHQQSDFQSQTPQCSSVDDREALAIDWNRWKHINPDVVGWLQIPGTEINQPLVQSLSSDPTFYLDHNVYRSWSFCGCPYLDYRNENNGLASDVCMIYGHHLDTGGVFSELSRYLDSHWAKKHGEVLLLSPEGSKELDVLFVRKVRASAYETHTGFSSSEGFEKWYREELKRADIVLDDEKANHTPGQVFCLITCAEGYETDWRIIVYAAERIPECDSK